MKEFPLSREKEIELLKGGIKDLVEYMSILIEKALDRFDMPSATREYLTKLLKDEVLIARDRFLKNKNNDNPEYKFSTYFTWYIHRALEDRDDVKKVRD